MKANFIGLKKHSGPEGPDIEYLFTTYYRGLCYFGYKMTGNKQMAEDVAQDSFIKYWNKRADFVSEASIKAFLYLTVRNACLNLIRHETVERKHADNHAPGNWEDEKGLEYLIRAEVLSEIHKAIENLPKGCRQVLKLAYFGNLKNEEIASTLGVSVNTVKTHKQRAISILRHKLTLSSFLILLIELRSS